MNSHQDSTTKPQVVIIGGGFGGLYTAQGLKNSPVSVKLIDKRNFHLFQPLLYQVATEAFPLRIFLLLCEWFCEIIKMPRFY